MHDRWLIPSVRVRRRQEAGIRVVHSKYRHFGEMLGNGCLCFRCEPLNEHTQHFS